MSYNQLKQYIQRYQLGQIKRIDLIAIIALWQRGLNGRKVERAN